MAEIQLHASACNVNADRTPGDNDDDFGFDDRRSMQSLSALTFVALWDPENGVIVLSAVDTTEDSDTSYSKPSATNLYHFPKASISDTESLNFYQPASSSNAVSCRSSECYRTLQSRHNTLFSGVAIPELQRGRGASQTSSTLGGLDVYLKGAALSTTHRHQPVYSFLNLNTDFRFPDDVEGAGIALDIEKYLKNGPMDKLADSWSTLESPVAKTSNAKPRTGRRLQKKRKPAPTSTDSTPDPALPTLLQTFHPWKLLRALGCSQKPTRDNYDWVMIDTPGAA